MLHSDTSYGCPMRYNIVIVQRYCQFIRLVTLLDSRCYCYSNKSVSWCAIRLYQRVLESVYASMYVPKCEEIASRVCPNTQKFRREEVGGQPPSRALPPLAASRLGAKLCIATPKTNVWLGPGHILKIDIDQ